MRIEGLVLVGKAQQRWGKAAGKKGVNQRVTGERERGDACGEAEDGSQGSDVVTGCLADHS